MAAFVILLHLSGYTVELFARYYRRENIGNINNFFVGLLLTPCAMAVVIPIVAPIYRIVQYIAYRFSRPIPAALRSNPVFVQIVAYLRRAFSFFVHIVHFAHNIRFDFIVYGLFVFTIPRPTKRNACAVPFTILRPSYHYARDTFACKFSF